MEIGFLSVVRGPRSFEAIYFSQLTYTYIWVYLRRKYYKTLNNFRITLIQLKTAYNYLFLKKKKKEPT